MSLHCPGSAHQAHLPRPSHTPPNFQFKSQGPLLLLSSQENNRTWLGSEPPSRPHHYLWMLVEQKHQAPIKSVQTGNMSCQGFLGSQRILSFLSETFIPLTDKWIKHGPSTEWNVTQP